jgi:SAM-dependent methyltransferase
MIGLKDGDLVLDAGCGYGHWTDALAQFNKYVVGIDINHNMVEVSRLYARKCGIKNVEFHQQALPHLDFPDEDFDIIWCWGVLMFVPPDETLREFYRLLKPGGRLLIGCCNSIGRWIYKVIGSLNPRQINLPLFRISMKALLCGHRENAVPNYTTINSSRRRCESHGFNLLTADFDGHIDLSGKDRKYPMFSRTVLGFQQNIEFIGEKL